MGTIAQLKSIPYGQAGDGVESSIKNILPLHPTVLTTTRAVSAAGTLSGSPVALTKSAGEESFTVGNPNYWVAFRFRASGDSNAVTVSSGSYPWHHVIPPGSLTFAWPQGIASVSADYFTTAPEIVMYSR